MISKDDYIDLESGGNYAITVAERLKVLVLDERAKAERFRRALVECEDYFDQRADADCVGDPMRYVGNEAMSMLGMVRLALGLRVEGE